MRSHRLLALAVASSTLALCAPRIALAASAANPDRPAATVEEVIVTAEKRSEPLKKVPMSVTAITGVELQKMQEISFVDYAASVPGLSLQSIQPGITRLTLRGENAGEDGSTVATYIDETPIGSSTALLNGGTVTGDFDTFDLTRIEVLRGPQGTLYGADSEGGLIKFVTNPPVLGAFAGLLEVGGQAVSHGDDVGSIHGMGNIPLGDTVAVRLDGFYEELPGYIDDPALGEKNLNNGRRDGYRASVLIQPAEKLTVRLTALGQETKLNGTPDVDVDTTTLQPLTGDLTQVRAINEHSDFQFRNFNGTIRWDLGPVNLVSSTSYGLFDTYQFIDGTVVDGPLLTAIFGQPLGASVENDTHLKKFTQEVRLASAPSDRFEWLVGGFYTQETALLAQNLSAFSLATMTPPPGFAGLEVVSLASTYTEWAGFGSATFHFNRHFDIQAGGRYSSNTQDATEIIAGPLAGGGQNFSTPSSGDVFTYSVAPSWHINTDSMAYLRIATGFRPGGPNPLPPAAPANTPREFVSDRTTNYEAGVRSTLLDGRLSLDLAAYLIEWRNIQLVEIVNNFGIDGNGGTARSDGVEYKVVFVPVRGLNLTADGAYT
ncbi:MAG: TonB-dependent receptor, partial [Caulobacteraceae bacterium]